MLLKPALFIFLALLAGHIQASEIAAPQDGIPTQAPALTREDLNVVSRLIKRGFNLQNASLRNEEDALIQISLQINTLDDWLKDIQTRESVALKNLSLMHICLCIISILQVLGLWLLLRKKTCFAGAKAKDPDESSFNNMQIDSGSLQVNPFPEAPQENNNASVKNNAADPAVDATSKDPIGNMTYISSIQVEKATALWGDDAAVDRVAQQNIDVSNENLSALLALGAKIRLQGFKKIMDLHIHIPPKTNHAISNSIRYKRLLKQKKLRA